MRESGLLLAPAPAPAMTVTGFVVAHQREEERWRRFDNSVNAVSFGFVATAILISMFLVMAIFERFLRPRSSELPGPREGRGHLEDVDRVVGVPMKGGNLSPMKPNEVAGKPLHCHLFLATSGLLSLQEKILATNYSKGLMSVYAKGVSVLMPGQEIPTYIAHPAPPPCAPERILWPAHQQSPPGQNSS